MSETPDSPSTPTPTPTPAPYTPVPGPTPLKLPTAPAVGLRPPVPSAPSAGLTPPAPSPLRAPVTAAKLPERPSFVSPMPVIEEDDSDSIPTFLPIVAGFAAAVAIAFAVLLFLKN